MQPILGNRLRSERYKRGMTLKRAAQQAGISVSFLSDIERSVSWPSNKTLAALMDMYGITFTSMAAALPLDDAQREDAIHGCTIRDIVDDYDEAMMLAQAGNLGVFEL